MSTPFTRSVGCLHEQARGKWWHAQGKGVETGKQRNDAIAQPGQWLGGLNNLADKHSNGDTHPCELFSFLLVAVKQSGWDLSTEDQSEFPAKIVGIAYACAHPLA